MKSYRITAGGLEVNVIEKKGEGLPLLFVNGRSMQQGVFGRLRNLLSVPSITFDFPLMQAAWIGFPPSMKDFSDIIARLIGALGYDRVDLLGVSLGGAVAIECALRHPTLIRKLVLAGTTPDPRGLLLRPSILWSYATGQYGGKIQRDPRLMLDLAQEVEAAALLTDWYRSQALIRWEGVARLPAISHSTLVLSGTDDLIVPPSEMEKLRRIPNARFLEIPDGHLFIWSSPEETAAAIEAFLGETISLAA